MGDCSNQSRSVVAIQKAPLEAREGRLGTCGSGGTKCHVATGTLARLAKAWSFRGGMSSHACSGMDAAFYLYLSQHVRVPTFFRGRGSAALGSV